MYGFPDRNMKWKVFPHYFYESCAFPPFLGQLVNFGELTVVFACLVEDLGTHRPSLCMVSRVWYWREKDLSCDRRKFWSQTSDNMDRWKSRRWKSRGGKRPRREETKRFWWPWFFFVLLFVAMGTGNTPGFLGGRGEGHPTGALGAQWRCLDGIGAAMSRSKLGSSGLLAIGRQWEWYNGVRIVCFWMLSGYAKGFMRWYLFRSRLLGWWQNAMLCGLEVLI